MVELNIEDQLRIVGLFARYCRGLDQEVHDEFVGVFWPDGRIVSPVVTGDYVGHEGIGNFLTRVGTEPAFAPYRFGQHWTTNFIFDKVEDDAVEVWSHFLFMTQSNGQPRLSAFGEYTATVTRRGSEWRFARFHINATANALA